MSSRLLALGYAKPDREKEEKAEKKRIEKERKERKEREERVEKVNKERIEAEKAEKERIEKEMFSPDIKSIYQDIKNKFPDIDIDFYIMCLNPQENQKYRYDKLYNIDLQTLNYNKYIAYKLLELMYYNNTNHRLGILISEYILSRMMSKKSIISNMVYIHHIKDIILKSKAFIKELDAKIFMDNLNIQWTILQNAIKNNLFKASPKPSPKTSPKPSPKLSPKTSPKPSPKLSPKTSPKASPKSSSPKASPKSSSPKASAKSSSPKASAKSSSPKTSPKASAKSSSPKASPINRDEMAGLTMEELFAKLAKSK
jgi:hypothetical protein